MKKLFAGIAAAALCGAPAFAADMPMKAPYLKAPVMAVYDWTGFYFGVNAGVGLGRDLTRWAFVPPSPPFSSTSHLSPLGAVGGAQAGYNWQTGNWVLGLEADIQAAGMRDDRTCGVFCAPGNAVRFDQKLDWFGTARGRVGLATGPVLGYVTGGFAYGGVKTSTAEDFGSALQGSSINISETRTGWTAGSGVEAALGGNWTGKIEYLYLDLGAQSGTGRLGLLSTNFSSEIREHIFRAGLNYRIGGNVAYAAGPIANWTGFYVGANGGGGVARNPNSVTLVDTFGDGSTEKFNSSPAGYLGGAQIGYNWQAANWVFGLEADVQGSTQKDDKSCLLICRVTAASLTVDQRLPWFGTVRGRAGYTVGASLFYATGGLAYGGVTSRVSEAMAAVPFSAEFKHTQTGWTVGGGVETPFELFGLFGRNWTAKTEYLYVDLGRATDSYSFAGSNHAIDTRVQEHIFRTGLNYHLNAPVVGRY